MNERGIGNEVYYPVPFHEQACFQHLPYKSGDFKVSEIAASQSIAVPIYPRAPPPSHRISCRVHPRFSIAVSSTLMAPPTPEPSQPI